MSCVGIHFIVSPFRGDGDGTTQVLHVCRLVSGLGEVEDALGIVHLFTMLKTGDGRHLALERNPWIMPPEAIVEEGLPAIEAYLMDVRAAREAGAEVKTLQLLKVVLVGSSQAGKTRCLPATLTYPYFFIELAPGSSVCRPASTLLWYAWRQVHCVISRGKCKLVYHGRPYEPRC